MSSNPAALASLPSAMIRLAHFLLLSLLLFALVMSSEGAGNSGATDTAFTVVSTADEFYEAILDIQNNPRIYLNLKEIQLTETIKFLNLNEIELKGIDTVTTVKCPPSGNAFRIDYASLSFLAVRGCLGFSAIDVRSSHLEIKNSIFADNHNGNVLALYPDKIYLMMDASDNGGALYLLSSHLEIRNCLFDTNSAAHEGGAIHVTTNYRDVSGHTVLTDTSNTDKAQITCSDTPIGGNVTRRYQRNKLSPDRMEDDDSTEFREGNKVIKNTFPRIEATLRKEFVGVSWTSKQDSIGSKSSRDCGNTNRKNGFGINGEDVWKFRVEKSEFMGNTAEAGAVIYFDSEKSSSLDVVVRRAHFKDNAAEKDGGAIYFRTMSNSAVDVDIDKSHFEGSKAGNTGGVLYFNTVFDSAVDVNIDQSHFEGSRAGDNGSVVYVNNYRAKTNIDINRSNFEDNAARGDGSVFYFYNYYQSTVTIGMSESHFEYNTAGLSGGVMYFKLPLYGSVVADISRSYFRGNAARQNGGVIYFNAELASSMELKISETRFEGNEAGSYGGVISLATGDDQSQVVGSIVNTAFVNNSADLGGALDLRSAFVRTECRNCKFGGNTATNGGGAILTSSGSTFTASETVFTKNIADGGGAILCQECGSTELRNSNFSQNVAKKYGGAVQFLQSSTSVIIASSAFKENVAAKGGAIYFLGNNLAMDMNRKARGGDNEYVRRNVACSGGAMYTVFPRDFLFQRIEVTVYELTNNAAVDCTNLTNVDGHKAFERWKQLWEGESKELSETFLANSEVGKGGAIFATSEASSGSSEKEFRLSSSWVNNNSALVGGGAYFDNSIRKSDLDAEYVQPSQRMNQINGDEWNFKVKITSSVKWNKAKYAAGGLFIVRVPLNKPLTHLISPSTCISEIENELCVFYSPCSINNTVEDGEYSSDYGLSPHHLHVVNDAKDLGTFRIGDRLVVQHGESNTESGSSTITLEVKDACNRTITSKNSDEELEVELKSDWISGKQKYKPEKGVISITDTNANGAYTSCDLLVECKDCLVRSVTLKFNTEPCSEGSLVDGTNTSCFRCLPTQYSFETAYNCTVGWTPCEPHAICRGTRALVPEDGYWHSTAFSPYMHKCILAKACSRENRSDELIGFYNDSVAIMRKIEEFNVSGGNHLEGYNQCSSHYSGILCGSCDPQFARSSNGECKECKHSFLWTWFLTAVRILLVTVTIGTKVYLSSVGVEKDIQDELRKQAYVISQPMSTEQGDAEPSEPRDRSDSGDPRQRGSMDRGPSDTILQPSKTASSEIHVDAPLLARADHVEDPLLFQEREEAISSKSSVASGLLSSIYNIAFDYIQLTSVALAFKVDWRSFKVLLSMQRTAGRIIMSEFSPFGCNFPDRDHDVGVNNSILSLWTQICFPVVAVGIYAVFADLIRLFTGKERRSKYDIDPLPSVILAAVVVFSAISIDMSTALFTVFSCVNLVTSQSDHKYAEFDVLGSRRLWTEDTDVDCYKGDHLVSAVLAAIGLSLFAAFFALLAWVLWRGKKTSSLNKPAFMAKFGFLYSDYSREGLSLFWELVIIVRRILIAAIGVFSSTSEASNPQIGLMAAVIFISIALHALTNPFEETGLGDSYPSYAGSTLRYFGAKRLSKSMIAFNKGVTLNSLEGMSLYATLFVFLAALAAKDVSSSDREASLVMFACFVFNGLFSVYLIYRLWYAVHHVVDIAALELGIRGHGRNPDDEEWNAWLLYKIWIFWKSPKKTSNEETNA